MKRSLKEPDYQVKINDVITNAENYHKNYYEDKTFKGPSLYFHLRALSTGLDNTNKKTEYIYAVLVSWGMHRMGKNGSKMLPFEVFDSTINTLKHKIKSLESALPDKLTVSSWDSLEKIFKGIQVMETKASLVGNSKVLAHLLPNLFAPIDREYTLNFLFGRNGFQNDIQKEWQLARKIHEEFYYPILSDKRFQKNVKQWMTSKEKYPWDTSPLKIVDNLVIGASGKR